MQPLVHFRRANTGLTRHGFAATMPTSGACAWLSPEGRVGVLVLIAGRMCARSRLRSHHPPPRLATSPATVEPNMRMVHLPLRSWSSSSVALASCLVVVIRANSCARSLSARVGLSGERPDNLRRRPPSLWLGFLLRATPAITDFAIAFCSRSASAGLFGARSWSR